MGGGRERERVGIKRYGNIMFCVFMLLNYMKRTFLILCPPPPNDVMVNGLLKGYLA